MLSTVSMIKVGKVYKNLMVDVQQINEKLKVRAQNIVMEATECEREVAKAHLELAEGSAKLAITMILLGCDKAQALERLSESKGHIRVAA